MLELLKGSPSPPLPEKSACAPEIAYLCEASPQGEQAEGDNSMSYAYQDKPLSSPMNHAEFQNNKLSNKSMRMMEVPRMADMIYIT